MALLPFNVSYIVLTPRRVRLPGEVSKTTPSPSKSGLRSLRWSTDISTKAGKSFRSLVGGKSCATASPQKEKPEESKTPQED
ncbi:hypothetical protein BDZ97DRAFT_1916705 [Flammula alnicola]|nr:hypothetical protein BDZ97DRAFT_1916705 [Flammula alnicola]